MKKNFLFLLLGVIACLLISCAGGSSTHPDLIGKNPSGAKICFFQFRDTTLMNNILVDISQPEYFYDFESKYGKRLGGKYWIPLYPKNIAEEPLFGAISTGADEEFEYINGDFYTIKDLLNSPKFIALKGGYYICYPFIAIETYGHYINAEWKDFYKTDFSKADIITETPYKKRYNISERTLVHLTKKSTEHFQGESAEMITIDDVVETLNKLIETNSIEDYCYELYHYPVK